MSTKIYYAWTWKCRGHVPALRFLRDFALADAATRVKREIREFDKKLLDKAFEVFLMHRKAKPTAQMRRDFAFRTAFILAIKDSKSRTRNTLLDIDASLNVWVDAPDVYAIGYGECWDRLPKTLPPVLADFSYYNNVDHPKTVSAADWDRRRRIWDRVCLDDWDAARLSHRIVDAKLGIGLREVAKRANPKGNVDLMYPSGYINHRE